MHDGHRRWLTCVAGCLALAWLSATMVTATEIPSDPDAVRSLDGQWRFKIERAVSPTTAPAFWGDSYPVGVPETFEPFFEVDYEEDEQWTDIDVPGNWEMQGHSVATYREPDNVSAFYRRWIEIPEAWEGKAVKVNFDGVQNGAEIWFNGQPVKVDEPSWERENYHESGWTAWQADLTPQVKYGEKNLLALRVTKNTESADLDSGDYFFLGGIYRPVTLFAVPETHTEDVTIRTKLLDDGAAEVQVLATIAGDDPARLSMRLESVDGAAEAETDGGGELELTQIVDKPRLWSAEHPELYSLTLELRDSEGTTTQRVQRRVGIREVTVDGNVLLVNGVPVKLAGMCRHDVYPSLGTAVNEEVWRKDLSLMKAANINTIRTSHYPYGKGFYELCDEMGFYVIDELPYCWTPTDDPEMAPAFLQRARETVRREKNHPSVIIWAVGNETDPGQNLQAVADLLGELDPTRPRLVTRFNGERYGVELDDRHYTTAERMRNLASGKGRSGANPLVFTENPNNWEVRLGAAHGTDYGSLDLWAEVLQRTWDAALESDEIAGLCPWEWQDRAVTDEFPIKIYDYDPATNLQFLKVKGIVDAWRNPRPQYYHVKMIYAPVQVSGEVEMPSPGTVRLDVENRYSFTDLSELETRWKLLRRGEQVRSGIERLDLAPRSSGEVDLEIGAVDADTLEVAFDHPGGWNVATYAFPLTEPAAAVPMAGAPPEGLVFPRFNLVTNLTERDRAKWRRIERHAGRLVNVRINGQPSDTAEDRPLDEVRTLEADLVLEHEPVEVVGQIKAFYADGTFRYRIDWTGEEWDIQELGWAFTMPEAYDRFSWQRKARWSWYPPTHIGRPAGTALPETAEANLVKPDRPDAFDFNSTKYDCEWATLTAGDETGLRVEFTPEDRHHVRGGFGKADGYQLIVNNQCSPPRDLSSRVVPDLYLSLSEGDTIEGEFRIGSTSDEAGKDDRR